MLASVSTNIGIILLQLGIFAGIVIGALVWAVTQSRLEEFGTKSDGAKRNTDSVN